MLTITPPMVIDIILVMEDDYYSCILHYDFVTFVNSVTCVVHLLVIFGIQEYNNKYMVNDKLKLQFKNYQ